MLDSCSLPVELRQSREQSGGASSTCTACGVWFFFLFCFVLTNTAFPVWFGLSFTHKLISTSLELLENSFQGAGFQKTLLYRLCVNGKPGFCFFFLNVRCYLLPATTVCAALSPKSRADKWQTEPKKVLV